MPQSELPSYRRAILQMVAYKRIQMLVGSALKQFDLNTTQWIVLGLLHDAKNGLRATDIAKSLQVEMPLITTITQRLGREGLVESEAHSKDRRAKVFVLTDKGKTTVKEVEAYVTDYMVHFRSHFDEDDLKQYFALLEKFMATPLPPLSSS